MRENAKAHLFLKSIMTLKNTTKIALLFAIMVTPMVGNAFADGEAEIVSICSFDAPGSIAYGSITRGIDSTETSIILEDTATEVTTIELQAGDWYGNEGPQPASATITINLPSNQDFPTGTYFQVNGASYNSVTDGSTLGPRDFHDGANGDNEGIAQGIADAINLFEGPSGDVSAYTVGDVIHIVATAPGTAGNGIQVEPNHPSWDGPGGYTIYNNGPEYVTFGGDDDGIVHLQSEVTKFNLTIDGSDSSGTTYAEKTPIGQANDFVTLTTDAQPFTDVNISFQITGVDPALENMPYSGSVTQTMTFTFSCTE